MLSIVALVIGLTAGIGAYLWRRNVKSLEDGLYFDADDPDKLAAEAQARETLPHFVERLTNRVSDEHDFSLKYNINPDGDGEFIWATDIVLRGDKFYGVLDMPSRDHSRHEGEQVEIEPSSIVDWTYFKGDVAQGHFITQVQMQRMPKRIAARGRRALGWSVE